MTEIASLIERAFDYRGFVTLKRRDGSTLVGYIYDRGPEHVELFDEKAANRIRLALSEIADVVFTGEDIAAKAASSWERRHGKLEPRDTSKWGDWEDRPTLILVALARELRGIARVLGARPHGPLVTGRLGERRAIGLSIGMGGGAANAIASQRPGLVVTCGLSGALDPALRPGDIVLATSVCDESGDSIAPSAQHLQIARRALSGLRRVAEGEILCATRVAATRQEKRALAHRGRLAVDLESWAAARAAHKANIPWLAIRVVVDPLDSDLPPFVHGVRDHYFAAAVRHALTSSQATLELARLALRARAAERALERALLHLAPAVGSLHPEDPR